MVVGKIVVVMELVLGGHDGAVWGKSALIERRLGGAISKVSSRPLASGVSTVGAPLLLTGLLVLEGLVLVTLMLDLNESVRLSILVGLCLRGAIGVGFLLE